MHKLFMKFFRGLIIPRFTSLDLIIYVGNAGFQAVEYGLGRISILEIVIRTSVLILVWGLISISFQLYLGTKSFN